MTGSDIGLFGTVVLLTVLASVVVGVLSLKFGWTSRMRNLIAALGAAAAWFLIYYTVDPKWSRSDAILTLVLPMMLTPLTTLWLTRRKEP
jgi:hypothetical protein